MLLLNIKNPNFHNAREHLSAKFEKEIKIKKKTLLERDSPGENFTGFLTSQ